MLTVIFKCLKNVILEVTFEYPGGKYLQNINTVYVQPFRTQYAFMQITSTNS